MIQPDCVVRVPVNLYIHAAVLISSWPNSWVCVQLIQLYTHVYTYRCSNSKFLVFWFFKFSLGWGPKYGLLFWPVKPYVFPGRPEWSIFVKKRIWIAIFFLPARKRLEPRSEPTQYRVLHVTRTFNCAWLLIIGYFCARARMRTCPRASAHMSLLRAHTYSTGVGVRLYPNINTIFQWFHWKYIGTNESSAPGLQNAAPGYSNSTHVILNIW